jgi:hypothetical protein
LWATEPIPFFRVPSRSLWFALTKDGWRTLLGNHPFDFDDDTQSVGAAPFAPFEGCASEWSRMHCRFRDRRPGLITLTRGAPTILHTHASKTGEGCGTHSQESHTKNEEILRAPFESSLR